MVKVHLIFMICIVSGFLLTLQFIALQILVRNTNVDHNPQWLILNAITSAAYRSDFPLFLIDPTILAYIDNGTFPLSMYSYCKLMCSGRKLTHLATLGSYATHLHLAKFTEYLHQKGYTVLQFNDFDPTLLYHHFHVNIPLHLIVLNEDINVKRESYAVHIVVFHDRIASAYWWRGPLQLSDSDKRLLHRQRIRLSEFQMSFSSAIYDKVEIKQTYIDGLILNLPSPVTNFMISSDDVQFIECNKSRANKFIEKYGRDESEDAIAFRTKAFHLLSKAKRLLDDLKIPFWLSSGTCLGYYRECDFITYGRDVDIGIWIDDYRPELIHVFSINDLPLIHSFGKIDDSFELSFIDRDIKLDIFFFYKEYDYVWNGGTQSKTGLKFKYRFSKFTLCWTEFYDLKVRVPCQTQQYIEDNYGKNWSEPIKEWDWKSSPANVKPNGQWSSGEWNDVIKLLPIPEFT